MICKACREAGNYIRAVDLSYDFIDKGDVEAAQELHGMCKGGAWCDCRHHIDARGVIWVKRDGEWVIQTDGQRAGTAAQ